MPWACCLARRTRLAVVWLAPGHRPLAELGCLANLVGWSFRYDVLVRLATLAAARHHRLTQTTDRDQAYSISSGRIGAQTQIIGTHSQAEGWTLSYAFSMKRYYFDIRDAEGRIFGDLDGVEFPDIQAVQEEAALSLAEIARDRIRLQTKHPIQQGMAVQVRDDQGPVLQATFHFEISPAKR